MLFILTLFFGNGPLLCQMTKVLGPDMGTQVTLPVLGVRRRHSWAAV
jgi:hypothetical protein